jgi:hypothetical protein
LLKQVVHVEPLRFKGLRYFHRVYLFFYLRTTTPTEIFRIYVPGLLLAKEKLLPFLHFVLRPADTKHSYILLRTQDGWTVYAFYMGWGIAPGTVYTGFKLARLSKNTASVLQT